MVTVSERWEQALYVAIFFGIAVALGVGGLVRSDRASSSLEQRTLAQRPTVAWVDLVTGEFGRNVETYLSDQFLGRDTWVRSYAQLSLRGLGKVDMNGVVIGKGGILLGDMSSHQPLTDAEIGAELEATMAQFDRLKAAVTSYGGTLLVVGHPTKNSFLRADYPAGFAFPDDLARIAPLYFAALKQHGVASVDVAAVFEKHRDEKLYYDTDHHWTFTGAHLAYSSMLEGLGIKPLALDELVLTTLPNKFVGSFNRKIAMTFPQTEKITIASPRVPIPYTRVQDGKVSHDLFKAHPAKASVAYGIYDQGDRGEIVIDTNRPKLPSLLFVGDSFGNAIETLAWTGFDESRYLDLRHYTAMSLLDYVAKYKPDDVVILVRDERYLYRNGNGLFTGSAPSVDSEE